MKNLLRHTLVALCLCGLLTAQPEEERVTEITSEKLFFDYEGKQAIFTGNVVVIDADLQLTGDKLTVYMTEEDEIERLVAEGNVEIKMDGMRSRSEKAVYTLKTGMMVLTERPQVFRDGSILQAEKMTYSRFEDTLDAPNARMIILQEASE